MKRDSQELLNTSSVSMIRGSLTEPRRKPNHDDVIWGFFLSVKLVDLGTFTVSAAIDDRTLKLLRLGDGRNSI
ncbi:hypothetical protein CEXT_220571 [Caerostris extrusa]|uniref:Uncharacterized protein n=1 Tax=Caerostris extrusa TaxID=172846 RepID=A0AAV4U814_CAEEX|nr:hypothetical protein CEXT_220571 [Caerostris extrusa]